MKRKPGQIALDAIIFYEAHLDNDWHDMRITTDERKSCFAELRAWRAAFKKMAGARIGKVFALIDTGDEVSLCKSILKARKVEGRRR